ncbi:hypothetical protein A3709_13260 [Halioglobus sp. HI00S01]|uniref:glycosyl transferase family protein n=1 Tax=Halioglobus sp. HI00S01 TaxID=1822214 RepID=UPI0007C29287|nr:glycosyl transferase family protein [Halioglobus sp. HI00S01]KZX60252.1 hypothetical protein A3709_13260 [Halioglobus sp. HI00S01]
MTTDFQIPREEHPFAPYIRILGKGKTGSRSLDRDEARTAFTMLLRGEADPMQVGAFLMLLRVKEETGEELAGFVDACRAVMTAPPASLNADLDWPSYAGKRAQHPWFLLSVSLLAQAGYRVFLHGGDGHTQGRLYTEQAMRALGLPVADDWTQVAQQLDTHKLSYLPLRHFCAPLNQLMQLRPLLGLRSPVNTLTRMLNPLGASASIHSIFHPAYGALHHAADKLLGQPRSLVFKGDSGEVEIKPQAKTRLLLLDGEQESEQLMARTIEGKAPAVGHPTTAPLQALWRGESHDNYGLDATLATTAAALLALGYADDLPACELRARALWDARNKEQI